MKSFKNSENNEERRMTSYEFFTDTLSFKTVTDDDGVKEYFVEGYISTEDLDRVGDIVTKEALQDMVEQIKSGNIKLDVEHEAWKDSPNIIPIGKIVDAKLDTKGIYVRAVLNRHTSRFKEVWNSVKNGFLDAFSIAYKVVKKADKKVGEKMVRLLDKVELLNVALTGNPANPEARITNVMMKSLEQTTEVDKMVEETKAPVEELKEEPVEEKSEESVEETPEAEPEQVEEKSQPVETTELKEMVDKLNESLAEFKSAREEDTKTIAELKSKLDAAMKALEKPQVKAVQEEQPQKKVELPKTPLGLIR